MKKIIKHGLVLMVVAMMLSAYAGNKVMAQGGMGVSITYQDFYDGLSPYGTWIDYPVYGHVWHPKMAGEFRPYLTNGYWDYSTDGWMWMSSYDWGWAPFHYGRWVYDDLYGWLWIPGYEWSPAWVTWGMYDNFYAWAPLMPGVNVGIAFDLWRPAGFYWNVCGRDHIYDRDIFNRVERRDIVTNSVNRITVINNFGTTGLHNQYYSKGPDVHEVERFTNRTITPAAIRQIDNAGVPKHKGNEIQVYRPTVTNPQPREFRRVDNNNANPVHNDGDRISTERTQQNQNIDRLPVRRAPQSTFGRRSGGGGRKNH
jgi:hypothetical protein